MRQPRDSRIGARIRARRKLLGISQTVLADRAGISQTEVSFLERGLRGLDNRFTLAALARALGCSTADLTGQAFAVDATTATAQAGVSAIRSAVIEVDPLESATLEPRPLPEVVLDARLCLTLRLRADYAGVARLLPRVLLELHAHSHGPDRGLALRELVITVDVASFTSRYLGFHGEAYLASQRALDVARALGDPVMLGLAAWSLGHSATGCGSYERAFRLASRAVDELTPHSDGVEATAMLGQLHMLAAYSRIALGDRDGARGWADESARLAQRTGDTPALGLNFGPTNINIWWVSIETDGGEPGKAVEIASRTNPGTLTVSRQAALYLDTGRALARLERDDEALRQVLAAERIAPQRVLGNPLTRETARAMLERSARASALRGLCERLGVAQS